MKKTAHPDLSRPVTLFLERDGTLTADDERRTTVRPSGLLCQHHRRGDGGKVSVVNSNIVQCPKCGMRRLRAITGCPECNYHPWGWPDVLMVALLIVFLAIIGFVVRAELLQ